MSLAGTMDFNPAACDGTSSCLVFEFVGKPRTSSDFTVAINGEGGRYDHYPDDAYQWGAPPVWRHMYIARHIWQI